MSRGKSECKKSPEKELYAGKSFSKVQINWLHPTKERRYSFPIRQCLQNMDAFKKFLVSKMSGRPANVRSAYVWVQILRRQIRCALSLSGERCDRMASFSVVEWILVRVDARWFIVTDLVIDPSGLLCDLEQPAGGAGSLPNEVLATVMKELPLFKTVRYYHSDFDTFHL